MEFKIFEPLKKSVSRAYQLFLLFNWYLLCIFTFPWFVLTITSLLIFRILFSFVLRILYKGKITLLAPSDAAFANEKYANTMTINTFMYVKGYPDIDKLREKFKSALENQGKNESRPLAKLKLKVIQKFGFFCWEDCSEQFNIKNHIRFCPGAASSHIVYQEKEVLEAVEKLVDNLFRADRPQWEILIVPRIQSSVISDEPHYALLFRVYHPYLDGMSLIHVLRKGFADNSGKLTFDPLNPPIPKLTLVQRAIHYLQVVLMTPCITFRTFKFSTVSIFQSQTENSGPKFIGCTNMDFTQEAVNSIRKRFGCTTTTLFSSIISGAMEFAAKRKALINPSKLPFAFSVAVVPYPNENLQNRVTVGLRKVPLGIKDPIKRLKSLDIIVRSLAAYEVTSLFWSLKFVGLFPAYFIRKIMTSAGAGFALTNLPGFADKPYIDGGSVETIYGCPPTVCGLEYAFGAASHNGRFRICCLVESSRIMSSREDVNAMVANIENQFRQLEESCFKR